MLISCKCLNFIATSSSSSNNHHQQQQQTKLNNAAVATADDSSNNGPAMQAAPPPPVITTTATISTPTLNGCAGSNNTNNSLGIALMHAFLQKYPRNFVFYSQCMDFFKQSIGPIPDLTINAINQRDLIYSLTLDLPQAPGVQSWQISICINCNIALCAKRLQAAGGAAGVNTINSPPQFLINCCLSTTNDELSHRRADKSFSETFGLLIMDHPQLTMQNGGTNGITPSPSNLNIGMLSTLYNIPSDLKTQRLRQLQLNMQQRLKREIAETDERIQRYTEQQFALLKSFREKSEQEFGLLVQLIQRVPEQQAVEWLDRMPPALDVTGGGVNFTSRRRNTISSRRDLNLIATITPTTTPTITTQNGLSWPMAMATISQSAMDTSSNGQGTAVTNVLAGNRKMSNFDTPPATPEATPMSVGNSPTFRQQQQPQQFNGRFNNNNNNNSNHFQQQFPTPTIEAIDDCLFDLEGVDGTGLNSESTTTTTTTSTNTTTTVSFNPSHFINQQQQDRNYQQQYQHEQLDSDDAEEAEDALDLDSSMPIPLQNNSGRSVHNTAEHILNFAKSLPIEIANSPMVERSYIGEPDDDEIDNIVDIAASIKALAKSVHGEAVFGDLPRPRLRSQI